MEIWSEAYQQRHNSAREKLDQGLTRLAQTLCPIDARALRADGSCPVRGRNIRAARSAKPAAESEREKSMSEDQRERQRQFWSRFNREQGEREADAAAARTQKPDLSRREMSHVDRIRQDPNRYLRH